MPISLLVHRFQSSGSNAVYYGFITSGEVPIGAIDLGAASLHSGDFLPSQYKSRSQAATGRRVAGTLHQDDPGAMGCDVKLPAVYRRHQCTTAAASRERAKMAGRK